MKTFFRMLIPVLGLWAFSGCLTITETYTFSKNGSGTMSYLIDMSEMASLIKMAEQESEMPMQEEMNFSEFANKLQGISGISSIESIEDKENYKFGLSFKFDNVGALNQAMNRILNEGAAERHEFFKQEGKVLTRTHFMNNAFDASEMLGTDEEAEYAKTLMQSMAYNVNFTFKQPVKVVYSAAKVELGGKKNREVKIQSNLKDLLEDSEKLNASIIFK